MTFCTHDEYTEEEAFLQRRFDKSITIPGTKKLYAVIPFSMTEIIAKSFSNANESPKPFKVMKL